MSCLHSDSVRALARVGCVAELAAEIAEVSFQPRHTEQELTALMTAKPALDSGVSTVVAAALRRTAELLHETAEHERAAARTLETAGASAAAGALAAKARQSENAADDVVRAADAVAGAFDAVSAALSQKARSLDALAASCVDGVPLREIGAIIEQAAENKFVSVLLEVDAIQDSVGRWLRDRFLPFAEGLERQIVDVCDGCRDTVESEINRATEAVEAVTIIEAQPAPTLTHSELPPPAYAPENSFTQPVATGGPSAQVEEMAGAVLHRARDFGTRRDRL